MLARVENACSLAVKIGAAGSCPSAAQRQKRRRPNRRSVETAAAGQPPSICQKSGDWRAVECGKTVRPSDVTLATASSSNRFHFFIFRTSFPLAAHIGGIHEPPPPVLTTNSLNEPLAYSLRFRASMLVGLDFQLLEVYSLQALTHRMEYVF